MAKKKLDMSVLTSAPKKIYYLVQNPLSKDVELSDILSKVSGEDFTLILLGTILDSDNKRGVVQDAAKYYMVLYPGTDQGYKDALADALKRYKDKTGKDYEMENEDKKEVTESMHYYTTQYTQSHEDKDEPINVVSKNDKSTFWNFKPEQPNAEEALIKVPASILNQLDNALNRHYDTANKSLSSDVGKYTFHNTVARALANMLELLSGSCTVADIKQCQIFMNSLMSPMFHEIPTDVVKFVTNGGVVRSLKNYVNSVKNVD